MSSHAAAADPVPIQSEAAARSQSRRHRRTLRHVLNLEDFERLVRRRLPRAVYGYVSGGSESGAAYRNNRDVFAGWHLVTRILRDVSRRDQSVTLFGHRYASPFAIAPMGASAVVGYDADNRMAAAAAAANIPFILSANSITPMEEIGRTNPHSWFAAYQQPDARNIREMCERVAAAGLRVFVLTVDVPVGSNRENNIRSGYTMPLRLTPRLAVDGALHPRWTAATALRTLLRRGIPAISNIEPSRPPDRLLQTAHRRHRPRRLFLAAGRADPAPLAGPVRAQGHPVAGGRAHRPGQRRGRDRGVEPWRPPARHRGVADGGAGRDQGGGRRHDRAGR